MPSVSAPFGFRPSFHNSGYIRTKVYNIATGYAVNIFQYDPVKLSDGGVIQLGTSDGTRSGTTDGVNVLGILNGVTYIDGTGKPVFSNYWPASTAATNIRAFVYDDPETLFDVQYNNPSSGTTVQADVGEQCDWNVASPGGSTFTGLSTARLGAVQAGAQGQFQITGFSYAVGNSLTDAFVVATVRINEHNYKAAVTSV